MTLTLYQVILGLAVLIGITVLAVLRIVNADAAVGVFFSVLGYVFGVAVPSGRAGNGAMFKPPAPPPADTSVVVVNPLTGP